MKNISEAIKKALSKSDENMPHTRDEMIDFAMDIAMGATTSPGKFAFVVGNKNKLLRLAKAAIGKLKDKPIMVKEGEKVIGKLLRK